MKGFVAAAVCLVLVAGVAVAHPSADRVVAETGLASDSPLLQLRAFIEANPELVAEWDREYANVTNTSESLGSTLNCKPSVMSASESVPTSVHKLRPGDVKVVAAVGDSITAAFAARSLTLLTIFREFRQYSWSIGGYKSLEKVTSVPNILKKFNPDVHGVATGADTIFHKDAKQAGYDLAVSGAIAKDMPKQVTNVIAKMKADPAVDYENDWKVVTLWIGGNDLCAVCKGKDENTPANYAKYIGEALDILLAEMPRVYVNVVGILDVSRLAEFSRPSCFALQSILCSCVRKGDKTRAEVTAATNQYQALTKALADNPKYQTESFSVSYQPFFKETDIPRKKTLFGSKPDRSYFAPDCFHFTGKAHAGAAVGLWNNMLEPEGEKETRWYLGEGIKCPSDARPFLCTPQNNCA